MTTRQVRIEVIKNGICVSLGKYKRAKKHALTIFKSNLIEHYAKLGSYKEDIKRTNPCSIIK